MITMIDFILVFFFSLAVIFLSLFLAERRKRIADLKYLFFVCHNIQKGKELPQYVRSDKHIEFAFLYFRRMAFEYMRFKKGNEDITVEEPETDGESVNDEYDRDLDRMRRLHEASAEEIKYY